MAKQIDRVVFYKIKKAQDNGVTSSKICTEYGINFSQINRLNECRTFDDYLFAYPKEAAKIILNKTPSEEEESIEVEEPTEEELEEVGRSITKEKSPPMVTARPSTDLAVPDEEVAKSLIAHIQALWGICFILERKKAALSRAISEKEAYLKDLSSLMNKIVNH